MARRLFGVLTVVLTLAVVSVLPRATACPFCSGQGQTLVQDIAQASMVLYGTFSNAKLDASGEAGQGTTDFNIDAVIKKHEILGDKKVITLPRYVPTNDKTKKFLVFCDVFKGKIDPYRGVPVEADSDMVKYLEGALKVQDKGISQRLRFYFDYLDNKEIEIATDSYKEFSNADYKDYAEMAKKLPPNTIAKWLKDANTPTFRYGLYASMLGHCGDEKHAALLRQMLDDPQKRLGAGVDGILAGYVMLKPKEGWAYLCEVLKDPKHEFMFRYAGLQAVRFFWTSRPDVIDKKDLVKGVTPLLDQSDIADLVVEDLRKWGRWELCDQIVGLQAKKSHDIPIIRRAIVRYALTCNDAKAAEYVAQLRKKDPEMVKDIEELLKLEAAPAVSPVLSSPALANKSGK